MLTTLPNHDALYKALQKRDPEMDGVIYVCVKTTGIFCRAICPARTPNPENIIFVASTQEALNAGYRPCKRCHPLAPPHAPSKIVEKLLDLVDQDPSRKWSAADIKNVGIDPATARRHFQRRFDMTFSQYVRARRLGQAFQTIKGGDRVIEAQLDAGFESSSGFREAFARQFGEAPNKSRNANPFAMQWIDSPLGPMLAVADETHLHMLEFIERKNLQDHLNAYRKGFNAAITPGNTPALDTIKSDLANYFSGNDLTFKSTIADAGTKFQNEVWYHLRQIPAGETRAYADLAKSMNKPKAVRAVANANRQNRCAIILPCHRVIGSNGSLTGYAGGLWRKQWLLEHERRHTNKTLL